MVPKFGAVACLLATLRQEDEWIFIKFQDRWAMTQEKIWIIWVILGLTPWVRLFFYFLDPCLAVR